MKHNKKYLTIRLIGQGGNLKSNSFLIFQNNLYKYLLRKAEKDNIKVINDFLHLPNIKSESFFTFQYYLKILYKVFFSIKRKEIIVITNPNGFYFKVCSILRNKKIIIFHDNFIIQNKMKLVLKSKGLLKKLKQLDFLFRYVQRINTYDIIATVSNNTKQELIQDLPTLNKNKIVNIGNGVDTDIFKQRNYFAPKFKDSYILYVGSEYERKNISTMLSVYYNLKQIFPKLKLYKVGRDHNHNNRQKTLAGIKKLNLSINSDVIFFDEIDTDTLVDIYNHAQLLLFPSLKEGYGFPIVEAMVCGCPVVTSNISPIKELVKNPALLSDPLDIDRLTHICKKILGNKHYRDIVSQQMIITSKLYSFEHVADNIVALIRTKQ